METGTLQELNVKPGDVVEYMDNGKWYPDAIGHKFEVKGNLGVHSKSWGDGFCSECIHTFLIISRAPDTPRTWGEMTDIEKGALLLAFHEGKAIEANNIDGFGWYAASPAWMEKLAYRIRHEPKRETVQVPWGKDCSFALAGPVLRNTHRITLDLIDGTPDCASIKMERLP